MIAWLSANIGTILIGLVVLAVVIAIVCSIRKDEKIRQVLLRRKLRRLRGLRRKLQREALIPCVRPRRNRFGRTGKRWRYAL